MAEEGEKPDDWDGKPTGKSKPFTIKESYPGKGRGTVVELESVTVYETGRLQDAKQAAGILYVGDFWGWNSGRTREIADHIAKCTGALVVIPRLLDDPLYGKHGGQDKDGLPEDVESIKDRLADLKPWLMKYSWELLEPKVTECLVHLRAAGAKKICGIGFGFGGWICQNAAARCGEWCCGILAYPRTEFIQTFYGDKCMPMCAKVKGTTLFLLGEDGPDTYRPGGEIYEAALRINEHTESIAYEEVKNEFLLRGDEDAPGLRPQVEACITYVTMFARKKLWPPVIGANASTLRLAAQDGDYDWCESLLLSGVPAGGKDAQDLIKLTPIHYAAREGHEAPGKLLIEYQADPNEHGGVGDETSLHLAAQEGHHRFVEMALKHGGNTEIRDKAEQTPMHRAAKTGHPAVVKVLVKHKADINAIDTAGQTALHFAAWHGHLSTIKLLLGLGQDVDPEDLRSQTPQDRAEQQGFRNCVDHLQNEREHREAAAFEAAHKDLVPVHGK